MTNRNNAPDQQPRLHERVYHAVHLKNYEYSTISAETPYHTNAAIARFGRFRAKS